MEIDGVEICNLCAKPLVNPETVRVDGPIRYSYFAAMYQTDAQWKKDRPNLTSRQVGKASFDICAECFENGNADGLKAAFGLKRATGDENSKGVKQHGN